MSLYRLLLRSLRRPSSAATPTLSSLLHQPTPHSLLTPRRSFAFSSAEEAAAERRRRKRRLRIEPPLHALRRDPHPPTPRDPNAPRLPDSTSALVGPRLNLHNRVQSLIRAGDLDAASAVARHSVFSNTRPTVFTCNAIIAAMYRGKRYTEAVSLFQFFFNQSNIVPNIVSYNNLINTHCDEGRVDVGIEIYRYIIANAPFSPSPVTFRHLTKGLIDSGRIEEAVDLLREMLSKGHGADSLVYNNLISGFLNLGNLDKANELFDELKERCLVYDGVVNATFMEWFFNNGREKEAMESYKSLLDRQFKMIPATCNVLLEVLLKHGKKIEALALFDQMLDNHTPPNFQAVNSETFNIMVNECFKHGEIEEAIATFRKVGSKVNSKPFAMDVAGYNNMITRYCEIGMLSEAEMLFSELCSKSLSPDVNTYKTLIDAYLKVDRIDDGLKTLCRMVEAGLRVVAGFCNRVFEEFIKNGKAVDCAQILKKMGEKDPKPDVSCYEVVIKGLCNEESFDSCRELLEEMIRCRLGVNPTLQQFVNEAFGKAGRTEEIERVLSMNRWGHTLPSRMTGPRQQSFGRAQVRVPENSGYPPRNGFHQPQPQQPSQPAQMVGPYQMASVAPQMTAPQNIYSAPSQTSPQNLPSGAQMSSVAPQMTSPQNTYSASAQMSPQHAQMTSPQNTYSASTQMSPQQSQMPQYPQPAGPYYHQMSQQYSQMDGWSSRAPSQPPPSGHPRMPGQYGQQSDSYRMSGQQQLQSETGRPYNHNHHQMSEWRMGAPQHSPPGPSQLAGPYVQQSESYGQQHLQSESNQPQVTDQFEGTPEALRNYS
ncbi:pentatricopeptide repeat-containing protein At1g10270 [Cannabis sativa]|uniref:pentatricopeptide repeat-containing protein At1g10270 n=1 Tax=Cannabis sativa TaxID=3483 RepID=UPI0029CAA097|nr:pentatricopeptide repeat-containing protein At1g10270 [Cannabis sativa]